MTSISFTGTPGTASTGSSNSLSKQGSWGSGQTPVAGDLLVAAVTVYGTSSAVLGAAPAGWKLACAEIANGTTICAHYVKVAVGSDTAPTFTATCTGTAADASMEIVLYIAADSGGGTPVLFTTGLLWGTSGTITPLSGVAVPSSGCAAIVSGICSQGTTAATTTWTTPSGWTAAVAQTGSARSQTASYYQASLTSGSQLNATLTHSRTSTFQAATMVVIAPAGTTPPAFMVVQHAADYSTSGDSDSSNYAAPVTAGNCLVAQVNQGASSTDQDLTSITIGGSADNWGSLKYNTGTDAFDMSVWADPDCAGGGTAWVITGTASDTDELMIDMWEVSGLATTLAGLLDQSAHNEVDGTGASWSSDATGTTSQASEIAFGLLGGYNNAGTAATITGPSSPWVNEAQITPSTGVFQLAGYQILSSAGTVTYSGSSNMTGSNNYYGATVVTLKAASTSVTGTGGLILPKPSVAAAAHQATTYYVSPSGSDSNNGLSSGTPWQTVGKVNTVMAAGGLGPGDSVLFEGGQTWTDAYLAIGGSGGGESPGAAANPITIGTYGTGLATIAPSSTSVHGVVVYNVGGYTIENLIITGPGSATSGYFGVFCYADGVGQLPAVIVDGCDVSGWKRGVELEGHTESTDGWTDAQVTNNTVHDCAENGIFSTGAGGLPDVGYNFPGLEVIGNEVYNITGVANGNENGDGIYLQCVDGGVIEYNAVHDCGGDCSDTSAGPGAIWYQYSRNSVIRYNVAYNQSTSGADGGAFDLDVDCIDCTIEYNLAYNCAGIGVALYGGTDGVHTGCVVRYNVTWGNCQVNSDPQYGELAVIDEVADAQIYGNTFIARDNGAIHNAPVVVPGGGETGVQIWNNIFVAEAGNVVSTNAAQTTSDVIFQGNCYYASGTFNINWNGTDYASLSAWQSATSQEKLSGSATGIQANPLLVAGGTEPTVSSPSDLSGAAGLQVQPSSPCVGAGLNLDSLFSVNPGTQDFFGDLLYTPLWIGAYQVIAGTGGLVLPKPSLAGSGTSEPPAITGTGGLELAKPSLAGSGAEVFAATGALALPKPSLDVAGAEIFTATGSLVLSKPSLAGAAAEVFTAAGGLELAKPSLAGSGYEITGTGGLVLPKPAMAASGAEIFTATGGLVLAKPSLDAEGDEEPTGSGGLVLAKPSLDAEGNVTITGIVGSGGLVLAKPSLAGTAGEEFAASGGLVVPKPVLAGFAAEIFTATGGLVLAKPSLAGSGYEITGTGGLVLAKPALAATAGETFAGSGGLTLAKPALDVAAAEIFTATGGLELAKPVLAGSGTSSEAVTGTGAMTLPKPALDGAVTAGGTVTGTGTLTLAKPSISGASPGSPRTGMFLAFPF